MEAEFAVLQGFFANLHAQWAKVAFVSDLILLYLLKYGYVSDQELLYPAILA